MLSQTLFDQQKAHVFLYQTNAMEITASQHNPVTLKILKTYNLK